MSPLELLAASARALAANRFRSALTVLSITVGTFAIVLMSSLAESGLSTIKAGLEEIGGARLIFIDARPPQRAEQKASAYARGFRAGDGDRLAAGLPHVVEHTTFAVLGSVDVTAEDGTSARTDLVAGDARFLDAYRLRVARGRAFTEDEARAHAPVCLVGAKVRRRLWAEAAVGRLLSAGNLRCRVVGELRDPERFGISFGFDWDDFVLAPLEAAFDVAPEARESSAILLKTDAKSSNDLAKRAVNARLVELRHGLDDFTIYDFAEMAARFDAMFATMEAMVGVLAGIALLVGGVGIMNMMLVGVTERVHEIGLRKALGARPSDIGLQFLFEAVLLSGVGGAVGAAVGAGGAALASSLIVKALPSWQGVVARGAVTSALALALGLGALFGFMPARRAARLEPVAALRR